MRSMLLALCYTLWHAFGVKLANLCHGLQEGYDHSYFTISTFINDHIDHHAKALVA